MRGLSTLIDNEVVDEQGNRVGYIDELIISCRSGRIAHVVVKSAGCASKRLSWADLIVTDGGFVLKDTVASAR